MNRTSILIALGALALAASTALAADQASATPRKEATIQAQNLHLTISACKQDEKSWPPISDQTSNMTSGWEGVRSVTRRSDGVLRIVATVVDSCGKRPLNGGYSLQSNSISLSYTRAGPLFVQRDGKSVEVQAQCNCLYQMTYDISNVPDRKYKVSILGTGMAGPGRDPEAKPAPVGGADANPEALMTQALALEKSDKIHEAIRLYRRAARAGSARAANRLGEIFSTGMPGVTRDPVEAQMWRDMAKDLGG